MSHNYLNKRFKVNSPSLEVRGLGGGWQHMVNERNVTTPHPVSPPQGEGKRQSIYATFPWDAILAYDRESATKSPAPGLLHGGLQPGGMSAVVAGRLSGRQHRPGGLRPGQPAGGPVRWGDDLALSAAAGLVPGR